MILMLNGASSSGKTALARALQLQWLGPLLHLGTDTAIGMLPASYVGMKPSAREGIDFVHEPRRFYDVEVDTTSLGPHELARSILEFVKAHSEPASMSLLYSEFFSR